MTDSQLKFLQEMERCLQTDYPASLMVDVNGLSSLNGKIRQINTNIEPIMIELESGETISLDQIVAINGIFDQKYLGC